MLLTNPTYQNPTGTTLSLALRIKLLGTLSKIATPGMRIGWIIAPLTVAAKLAEAKSRMGYSTSHIGERLADRFLNAEAFQTHLSYIRLRLRTRRECLLGAIRTSRTIGSPVLSNSRPGGYYVWLKLNKTTQDKDMLEAAISEGVLCLPGRVFGADDGLLSFASIGEEQIPEGVRRLGRALRRIK